MPGPQPDRILRELLAPHASLHKLLPLLFGPWGRPQRSGLRDPRPQTRLSWKMRNCLRRSKLEPRGPRNGLNCCGP
eukprot:11243388-Alexandrium_andersonii.AAC.1